VLSLDIRVLAARGCRGGLCGRRPGAAPCRTHCRTQLSPSAELVVPLRKHIWKGKIARQREEEVANV